MDVLVVCKGMLPVKDHSHPVMLPVKQDHKTVIEMRYVGMLPVKHSLIIVIRVVGCM